MSKVTDRQQNRRERHIRGVFPSAVAKTRQAAPDRVEKAREIQEKRRASAGESLPFKELALAPVVHGQFGDTFTPSTLGYH
ncbi:MAG: hypothetical protein AAGJ83_04765 [Planctomycetota bacterium]